MTEMSYPFYGHSVLQNWVMELPLRVQGTLLTGVRGCDLAPKNGEDTAERRLVAFIRYCVLNPADEREIDVPGAFFQSSPPDKWKPSQFGHYPQHWYAHIMHCFEVIGYCHPDPIIAIKGYDIYILLVQNLHLHEETRDEMFARLTEDRIKSGKVVS